MKKPIPKPRKRLKLKSRWMLTGTSIVLVLVVVAVLAFSLSMYAYYYNGVQTGLEAKAKASSEFFTSYVSRTYAEYQQSAYTYAEAFEDKDSIELQFISVSGRVQISSHGISAGVTPNTPDIVSALSSGAISSWKGKSSTGERVMAVSAPLVYSDGSVVGVMRYVTSLKLVDRQLMSVAAIASAIGLAIVLIVVFTNLYFIRSITDPILTLTALAKRISEGSYGIQTDKERDDEIGDLTDSINDMSVKIAQGEKLQTEFISSVSHELRTPLTAITGWAETLAYDESIQGDSRRGIAIISKEASRLTKMVEELLEFTRIQDGRFNLNIEKFDITAELEDAVFTYGKLLHQDSIELVYAPPEGEIPLISGDPERLKQVFLNIIDNAAKYGRSGNRVVMSLSSDGDSVTVTVRDFGPGIPENELPHVKEKFYKGSSRERGSGIGLAVCDEIVSRHGGTLTIENAEGGGALVTVTLPVNK